MDHLLTQELGKKMKKMIRNFLFIFIILIVLFPIQVKLVSAVSGSTTLLAVAETDKGFEGRTATRPKNTAPTNVILFKTKLKYLIVEDPGLIPGIKPPDFCKFSEIFSGLKTTDV